MTVSYGLTELGFYYFVNKFRDPLVWKWNESGEWMMLDSVLNHAKDAGVDSVCLEKLEACNFKLTALRKEEKRGAHSGKYVLIGKGYVHI